MHFFVILDKDLTEEMDELRRLRHVLSSFNLTCITLVPKNDKPNDFNDYGLIYLCNILYNIITKIISEKMKPILGKHIS